MNCPKCDGFSTVISTRDVLNIPGARCRRRKCCSPICRHRWYALAPAEIALPHDAVNWSGSTIIVRTQRKVVECIETGAKYSTAEEAASAAFVSRSLMYSGLKQGTSIGGRRYRWSSTSLDHATYMAREEGAGGTTAPAQNEEPSGDATLSGSGS